MTDKAHVTQLTGGEFESFIEKNEIVFIDFWATWCAPCRQFARVYEQVAAEYDDIQFTKVNIEEESELSEAFQIRSIPHVMVFKGGIAIYSEAGSLPASTLKELVQQAKDADISALRAKLDADEK